MDSYILKYLESSLSEAEEKTLYDWVKKDKVNLEYFKAKILEHGIKDSDYLDFDSEEILNKLKRKIGAKESSGKVVSLRPYLKYAAAIALIISAWYFWENSDNYDNKTELPSIAETKKVKTDKIKLTLPDGSEKVIEESQEQLSYLNNQDNVSEVGLNKLIVPRGEVFKLILSDSTVVWVNADSKLSYPQYFGKNTNTRKVFLEGEAYFDVAHDETRPFIVETKDIDVRVLGTKFNISSYQKNQQIETTLIQGSVSVNQRQKPENAILITPNYQASFNKQKGELTSKKVDVSNFTAWIQKRIVFQDLPFDKIIEKIERVYNVEIENYNESLREERFTGEFDIEKIEVIFKALSTSIKFEYEINDNEVIIKK